MAKKAPRPGEDPPDPRPSRVPLPPAHPPTAPPAPTTPTAQPTVPPGATTAGPAPPPVVAPVTFNPLFNLLLCINGALFLLCLGCLIFLSIFVTGEMTKPQERLLATCENI